MDLIKQLTGKNSDEYNKVAKLLVNNADVKLFEKLVSQDEFLFDFIKDNVSKRIENVCTKDNYKNILQFFNFYSSSYEDMFARVLYKYGKEEVLPEIKKIFTDGSDNNKAYALKYFLNVSNDKLQDLIPNFREASKSDFVPLSINAIEVLSKLSDEVSKNEAIIDLDASDEFIRYNAVKFLVNYQAKDCIDKIIEVMKNSSFSENIATEIPYLIPIEELLEQNYEAGILVLCNIVNAMPEIIPPSAAQDYNLHDIFENLYQNSLDSISSTLLILAKNKFDELTSNEEYLFDCDKNTKFEIIEINRFLQRVKSDKLKSLYYDELYEDSNFVLYAVDFVSDKEALENLLDSKNQTLLLKVLSILKEKFVLSDCHKEAALKNITNKDIYDIIKVM